MQVVAIVVVAVAFAAAFLRLVAERRQAQLIPIRVKRGPR